MRERLTIGNCSGFFGDRQSAAAEVVRHSTLDVLTGDWLAELTMLILQKQRARDPLRGFASTFIAQLEEILGTCVDRGIRIVSNAGGMNPEGCARAVREVAARLGISLSVGTVGGDDLSARIGELVATGRLTSMTGERLVLDRDVLAANAYLGGWGIAACLDAGADVVVTGRVTDAALVTGPAAWAFGWAPDDWDQLAGAVAAGHVIECGAQATGGNFPFFDELGPDPRLGFPLAEILPDGSSIISKVEPSGGAVTVDTVTAQLLYEIQSSIYHNPDVSVRLDSIQLSQDGDNRVLVSGVRGVRPPATLKVSMATEGGWRNSATLVITGADVQKKAQMAERALWDIVPGGREAFDDVDVELIGRPQVDPTTMGEAVGLLRVAVSSSDQVLAGRTFSSAVVATALASYPGFHVTGPPSSATSFAVFVPALVDADAVPVSAHVDGKVTVPRITPRGFHEVMTDQVSPSKTVVDGPTRRVALGSVCGARSGDKGGNANVGFWVRDERAWPWLREALTADFLSSLLPGEGSYMIDRVELPNLRAVNFVVRDWLGNGVASNLALDSQAKGLAEFLRSRHVEVPERLLGGSAG